jgi:polyisoprenyl-phosphate glycosyltransferase
LTGFSVAPLRFATVLGLILAVIALIYGGSIMYETLVHGASVPGYPSVFVGVMVLGAVQLIMLGVVGEYIGKILYEIKARPVYFVAEHDLKLREEAIRPDARTAAE